MLSITGYLSVRQTGIATASVLGVIAATFASLTVIWKFPGINRPVRYVYKQLVTVPRDAHAERVKEEIQGPILARLDSMRRENEQQHKEVRDAMGVLSTRVKELEDAFTAPRKETSR